MNFEPDCQEMEGIAGRVSDLVSVHAALCVKLSTYCMFSLDSLYFGISGLWSSAIHLVLFDV